MNIQMVRKTAVAACMALAIVLGISSLLLFVHFHDGDTPASNSHAMTVYLTGSEHHIFLALQCGAYAAFLIGFLLNRRWCVFTDPLEELMGKQRDKMLRDREDG